MQVVMNSDFDEAYRFLFDEIYRMWKSDLRKIFRIGTRGKKGGCNLSSCILVLIGIESFSKFFSSKRTDVDAFVNFIDTYYPVEYHGKMRKIYELFRHGLAHYYYPKSELNLTNTSHIAFGVDDQGRVVPLSRLKKNLDNYRKRVLNLNPGSGKPYVIVPQVLFLDTINVMEELKKIIRKDPSLHDFLVSNYKKIRKILRHNI